MLIKQYSNDKTIELCTMKRIKVSQINYIMAQYLKRRRFLTENPAPQVEERRDHGIDLLTLHGTVQNMDSQSQAIAFSSVTGDPQSYDVQYSKFRQFMNDISVIHQAEELQALLYPLFVHMYLDMLCNGHKTPAHKFFTKHSGQFITSKHSDTVNELELMYTKEDIQKHTFIRQFRELKYIVTLSPESLDFLQRYLKVDDNSLLLQMFNSFIDIKISDCSINQDLFQAEDRDLEGLEPASQPCTPENKVIQDEVTLSSLQACVTCVRKSAPPIPSVLMYSVLNAYQGLCSTSFSADEKYLAAGFEDSSIRVWKLTPTLSTVPPSTSGNTTFTNTNEDNKSLLQTFKPQDHHLPATKHLKTEVNHFDHDKFWTPNHHSNTHTVLANGISHNTTDIFNRDQHTLTSSLKNFSSRLGKNKKHVNGASNMTTDVNMLVNETAKTKRLLPNISRILLKDDLYEDFVDKSSCPPLLGPDGCILLRGHCGSVYSTCFHANDSNFLLSASEDKSVRLWDVQNNRCVVKYAGHNYPVWSVQSSPTSDYFSSSSQDRTARLWSTDRTYPLHSYIGHNSDVNIVQFHPNGSYLASGSSDRTVRLWSLHEAKAVRLYHGHKAGVFALAFSADGSLLASAGEDRRIKLWDLASGKLFKDLRGHTDIIYSLTFNKHSNTLVSSGMDGTLRFWDVRKDIPTKSSATQETNCSPELLAAFSTKSLACVQALTYSKKNYVLLAGNQA